MEKKVLQQLFREHMKKLGYNAKGNACYKYIEADYLVVVFLEHCSYQNAYRVRYGAVYETSSVLPSPLTKLDWSREFLFTVDPTDDLFQYPIDDLKYSFYGKLTDLFDYSSRSEAEFLHELDENIKKRLYQVYDTTFILDQYRNSWISFRRIPYTTVNKICRLAGLDYNEVVRIRDSTVRKYP